MKRLIFALCVTGLLCGCDRRSDQERVEHAARVAATNDVVGFTRIIDVEIRGAGAVTNWDVFVTVERVGQGGGVVREEQGYQVFSGPYGRKYEPVLLSLYRRGGKWARE